MTHIYLPGEVPQPRPEYTGGRGDLSSRMRRITARNKNPGSDSVDLDTYFERGLRITIRKNFGDSEHFKVIREARKYRPSISKEIRDQLSGRTPQICEVYFDHKYLCDISEDKTPDMAVQIISLALIHKIK